MSDRQDFDEGVVVSETIKSFTLLEELVNIFEDTSKSDACFTISTVSSP